MNIWTERSIELANQGNYLDQLFKVYPLSANERRELDSNVINKLKYLQKNIWGTIVIKA